MNRNRMTKIKKSKTMNNWEKLKNLNANMKFAMLSTNKFYQDLLNSIWELLVLWTSKIWLNSDKVLRKRMKNKKKKETKRRNLSQRREKEATAPKNDLMSI